MIQREKIIKVIEAEARLVSGYLVDRCTNPGHCAVGALLHAAGVPNSVLPSVSATDVTYDHLNPHAALLYLEYGLTQPHVRQILCTNDDTLGDMGARREAVIACVHFLADAEAARATPLSVS